jgi:hypothetical protein
MEYGQWRVESKKDRGGLDTRTIYYVRRSNGDESVEVGSRKEGRKLARTLAATLDSAKVSGVDDVLPPEFRPDRHNGDEWEQWAGESLAVPAKVACAGKAPIAGWLKVVHKQSEQWIANRMDVSESTVRQYLSDLREGRR